MSVIEGDRRLRVSFIINPWGNFNSSDPNFKFSINSGDLAKYLASGGTYTTKWEVMTEAQKDSNQKYQGLPKGEKFPYFTHTSSGSEQVPCDCDPIKLEAFQDEQMRIPFSAATSLLIQTFAITNFVDKSATPFVDIVLDLNFRGTYQEIWVKVTDKLDLEFKQKITFSMCGAERFDESSKPSEILIEFDQNVLNDTAYEFEPVLKAELLKDFNLIPGPGNGAP